MGVQQLVFLGRHDMVEFPAYEGGSGKAPLDELKTLAAREG